MQGAWFLLLMPGVLGFAAIAVAGDWHQNFCRQAQQVIAGTELVAELHLHEDMGSFVKSRVGDMPLTVHAFFSNPAPGSELPRTLSCKMRTAGRINATLATPGKPTPTTGETDCAFVHRRMVERVAADIAPSARKIDPASILYAEDDTTWTGPGWLEPWPWHAAGFNNTGNLTLRARALYAPDAWWLPMPDAFKGNYYCHLVAPGYLEALIRGDLTVSAPQPQ